MKRAGYTLIEIVGAFLIMTIILTLVTTLFVENGRQREVAIEMMRERLSALGALDQMADDLEGAIFVSRGPRIETEEPTWRFQAEGSGELGASSLRFVTQNAPQSSLAEHASGWTEVAYFLDQEEDEGSWVLWRRRSSRPPGEAPLGFPDADEPGSMRLAEDVHDFGVRFLDSEGGWVDEWESSYQPPDQALPQAAEITLVLMRQAREGESEDGSPLLPGRVHMRRVAIPMRPVDVAALVALGQPEEDEGAECFTIADCLDEGDDAWYESQLESNCDDDEELCELLASPGTVCWSEIESDWPDVASQAPEACGS
jgi:type II secretory pathway component PulJ